MKIFTCYISLALYDYHATKLPTNRKLFTVRLAEKQHAACAHQSQVEKVTEFKVSDCLCSVGIGRGSKLYEDFAITEIAQTF